MSNDLRNWLERLAAKIPGYTGYAERERRRDLDKLHREGLADRLRAAKTPLTELVREMSSTGRLIDVGPVDRVLKKIDGVENRVRFASYGYSGFFDAERIEEQELQSIYQFDLALAEKVDDIEAKSRALKSGNSTDMKAAAADVEGAVDELNRTFDDRYRVINNFGQGPPPGGSIFNS